MRSREKVPFNSLVPQSIQETVKLRSAYRGVARDLYQAQGLVPLFNSRLSRFKHLCDINRIFGWSCIWGEEKGLYIGAMRRFEPSSVSPVFRTMLLSSRERTIRRPFSGAHTWQDSSSLTHEEPPTEFPAVKIVLRASFHATLKIHAILLARLT